MKSQNFKVEKNIKITSSTTSLEIRRTKSAITCADLCVDYSSCCSVSFDKQTRECQLDYNCFPQFVACQNGTILRKSSNVILSNQGTTGVQTSDKTTRDKTTTDMTYYKSATDKPSYQTTSDKTAGNTTTFKVISYKSTRDTPIYETSFAMPTSDEIITDTKASNEAKISDLPSFETTNLKTTSVKTTTVKTSNDITDCTEVASGSPGGVYTIYIENQPVDVYCELKDDDQWTVIQKRIDGTIDFYRDWQEYKDGFGNVNLEYWLGNDNLHKILSTQNYKLRIDLEDWNGDTRYAEYDTFVVGNENTNYMLTVTGYSGDAGDSMINPPRGSMYQINGMEFTTFDRDNDKHSINAAVSKHSGWWFKISTDGNLNGKFYTNELSQNDAIYWQSWHATEVSLKSLSMKIKPN
ncbi:Fibrinogen-like protein 1,Fibrinogen-like protein A,Tenascin,Angiopoietin-1,Fibrinogen C domain-containing protein 1-A,Techylectin-like protein,Microfibril-associated glycoprotein 4,Tenascin-R,Ficolin-1,Fibroleukin [Mytilus coruscus]|uniref:Fibrinogen C-terminal domain-containing protein n=1 Tax=Mytilus coruscus TaxID=42192 RepID=A0A6J8EAZ3_MYTCO|nr:Fibrinogen-like protein 1,Fibrinogen-like protein A,Tenascin,Angiopoietin-1,Fibrinogen C domain-containing protein 1-A,Techylectin-like protein,Microfibril-associated glycoprotein 4,Tenascin-R,Ficolin-1,Fibroleukin [Mytilus coruscus]